MSLCSRLKEARKISGLTQDQLAKSVGVAPTTLSGYETGHREPEMAVLYKIMKVLNVDANYLFQDEMRDLQSSASLSADEFEHISKYRSLDDHGKRIVTFVTNEEYDRCTEYTEEKKIVELTLERGSGRLIARNKNELTQEDRKEISDIVKKWEKRSQ